MGRTDKTLVARLSSGRLQAELDDVVVRSVLRLDEELLVGFVGGFGLLRSPEGPLAAVLGQTEFEMALQVDPELPWLLRPLARKFLRRAADRIEAVCEHEHALRIRWLGGAVACRDGTQSLELPPRGSILSYPPRDPSR